MTVSSNHILSVPFLLNKDFFNIKAYIGDKLVDVKCSNGYNKNSLCSALVDTTGVSVNSLKLTIDGYNSALDKSASVNTVITVNNNLLANLVTSAINPSINPSDGEHLVAITLLNNGTQDATNINFNALSPVNIEENTCGALLAPNETCGFEINATSIISGQSSLTISYNDGKSTQIIPVNVSYISSTPSPLLVFTPSGNFIDIATNQGAVFMTINVKNMGNTVFESLTFNDINLLNPAMSSFASNSTCVNGQSLGLGNSCNMVISYNPIVVESGSILFIAQGNYLDQSGNSTTYSNSSLTIPYSALNDPIFKAVGDFGMVISSPPGAGGTWSANVDSPFASKTISANSLLLNNGTYVMTLSNGLIKYSLLNGLFWQTSNLTESATFNSSTCSIIYDGSYYYTCGALNQPFVHQCTISGAGCIIRTQDLSTGWEPIFTPSTPTLINDVYFFKNGNDAAYIATLASNVANAGLATSNNGYLWNDTSSGQLIDANNNFTSITLNTATNNLTAWDTSSWSSTQSILNISDTWVANTSTRPTDSRVTSALFYDGNYVLTLANGSIYTTTDPNFSYARVWPGTTQLNKVIYANGINSGTYLAIGNNGINLTTDNLILWDNQLPLMVGQATIPNLTGLYYASDVNQIWVTGVSAILNSSDMTTWSTPKLQDIAKNGNNYLAIDNQGNIYSSVNATNWSRESNPTNNILNSVYCLSENFCFIVGNNGTILKTTDGINWQTVTSGTTNNLHSIICQSGHCVAVGGRGVNNSGTVAVSNDYNTWSVARDNLATTNLNGVAFFNNNYLAVGDSGSIFSSTNGTNWSVIPSDTVNNLNSVTCGNNLGCVAVGNTGTILFSTFGLSWVAAPSNTANDLLSVTYNKIFVTVGKSGVLRYSATGTGTWASAIFPVTSSSTNNLNAVISD
ncbi:MAG: hypothetical protein KBD37_09330 [Burkholderiales bacterium]|nr:hypothetical protein [Burkholderiales bacterium]